MGDDWYTSESLVKYMNPYTRLVTATRLVRQSPLSCAPPVPAGTVGTVEDELPNDGDAGLVAVDFGGDYGVVLCDPSEVMAHYTFGTPHVWRKP